MANTVNYATKFEKDLKQKYTRESLTEDLTTEGVKFINANTIKIPFIKLAGYKDHGRSGGFNRQDLENDFMTKVLAHDRDVEFFVDSMDVDESNEALSAANITNTFEEEQAIPERDVYRVSKLFAEYTGLGKIADNTVLTEANILSVYDKLMEQMDEAEVPSEGRILYVTSAINTMLKNADKIQRHLLLTNNNGVIQRAVRSLDDVVIRPLPSSRMKTVYDFTNGFVPGATAKQINLMLVQPKSIIATDKHSYIKMWSPGTHTQGDGFLYQNRKYGDLFIIDTRVDGVAINTEA